MTEKQPSIQFRLDSRSHAAPYRQLIDQVREAVAQGRLRGGDQLPSVRDVVTQVTINPNTVHRAYRELEHLGIAEGRLGLGTFITEQPPALDIASDGDELSHELRQWIQRAHAAGLDFDDMLGLLRRILDRDVRVLS